MNERTLYKIADLVLAGICVVVGIYIWGGLIGAFNWLVPIPFPRLIAAALMAILNIGHFLWGFFHTDPDISDIHTEGIMTSYVDLQRIGIRILAFITIGPSVYIQHAIETSRSKQEES